VPRYKLTIAYDGTDFCGWQKQEPPEGTKVIDAKVMPARGDEGKQGRVVLRTVQEVVERAVISVVREPVVLMGASRTDSGVHARGQVAAFTCTGGEGPGPAEESPRTGWPVVRGPEPLLRALNSRLPEDVLVAAAEIAPPEFDPIGGALEKAYSYTLHVSPNRPLWDRPFVHHIWTPLELQQMNEAAEMLVGEHDFAAFAAAGHGRLSTVRRITSLRVVEAGQPGFGPAAAGWERRLRIEVAGNGFLWNMVRILAGTLVEVGRGRLTPADIRGALATGDRRKAGPTLPPTGLCLEWVRYTQDEEE
jgi:tRNA pseudouridine38-40 synthase